MPQRWEAREPGMDSEERNKCQVKDLLGKQNCMKWGGGALTRKGCLPVLRDSSWMKHCSVLWLTPTISQGSRSVSAESRVLHKIKSFYYFLLKSAESPKFWCSKWGRTCQWPPGRCELLSLSCSDFQLPALRRLVSVSVFCFLVVQGHMADKEKSL